MPASLGQRMGMSGEVISALLAQWRVDLATAARRTYAGRLASLALFGSAARNRLTSRSDLDVLLIASNLPKSRMARNLEFEGVEDQCANLLSNCWSAGWNCQVSPLIMSPQECDQGSLIMLDMTLHIDILVDRDNMLNNRLTRLRDRMRELGSLRTMRGSDRWSWTLKPDIAPGEVVEL